MCSHLRVFLNAKSECPYVKARQHMDALNKVGSVKEQPQHSASFARAPRRQSFVLERADYALSSFLWRQSTIQPPTVESPRNSNASGVGIDSPLGVKTAAAGNTPSSNDANEGSCHGLSLFGDDFGEGLGVPEPILLSWQSRLNALPPFDLEVIKCASCIGTHVRTPEIAMCMAANLDDKVDVDRVIATAFLGDGADALAAVDAEDGARERKKIFAATAARVTLTATQLMPRVRAALSRLVQDGLVEWDSNAMAPTVSHDEDDADEVVKGLQPREDAEEDENEALHSAFIDTLSTDDNTYSFSHQLFHESVYGFCMTAVQRRAVHGAFSAAVIAMSIEYVASPNRVGNSFKRRETPIHLPTETSSNPEDTQSINHLAWLGDQLEKSGRPLMAWPLLFAASHRAVSVGAYQEGMQLALTALETAKYAGAARVTVGKLHTHVACLFYAKLGVPDVAADHALLGIEHMADGALRVPTCTSTVKLFVELSNFFLNREAGSALADSLALARQPPEIRGLVAQCWMVMCNVLSDDWVRRSFNLPNARAARNQRHFIRLRSITITQATPDSTLHIFGLAMMSRSHQVGTTSARILASEAMMRAKHLLAERDGDCDGGDCTLAEKIARNEALAHLGLSQGAIHMCEGDMRAMEASFNRSLQLFESIKNVTLSMYTSALLGMVGKISETGPASWYHFFFFFLTFLSGARHKDSLSPACVHITFLDAIRTCARASVSSMRTSITTLHIRFIISRTTLHLRRDTTLVTCASRACCRVFFCFFFSPVRCFFFVSSGRSSNVRSPIIIRRDVSYYV